MKVAQVVSTYPPYHGGMGNVAHEYTERLRARGHHVHVYAPASAGAVADPEYVHRLPSPLTIGNASFVPSLPARLSGFDVVHLHYPFFGGAEMVMIHKAVRRDQALVLTYHMDALSSGLKGRAFDLHRRLLLPFIIGRADRILVSTDGYARTSALSSISGAFEKMEVHPFGVDLERFHPGKEPALRESRKIREQDVVFLFVGGLDAPHAFKGVDVLLDALATLPKDRWQCLIAGDGDLRPQYEDQARRLGLSERVHFLGYVSDGDLPAYFRASDVHVFPSVSRSEAFGIVALEAAASGIPSVASDPPGVREVVLDGETGVLVAPRDPVAFVTALADIMLHHVLRGRLGLSARKHAEARFAWDARISALGETYRGVVKNLCERV